MLADEVIQRLKDRVDPLQNRVEGAASLVQLIQQNQLPQAPIAARVISAALQGGAPDAASGLYRQPYDETVSVYLVFRNIQGGNGLDSFDAVKWAVIETLCGWGTEDSVGVFRLVRGQVVRMDAGTLIYQIDFAIGDQLRINVT